MAVHMHEWQNPFAVVQTSGIDILGIEEKPVNRSYVNAGVYVLSPECVVSLNGKEYCDMPTLFERMLATSKKVIAYPMHEPWLDVGTPSALSSAQIAARDVEL